MDPRYVRNLGAISPEEQEKLKTCRVCLIGCGGLGGYLAEFLGRVGVGNITAVDGDRFEQSNLNRQLYAREDNLGQSKAEAVKARMAQVNPEIQVRPVETLVTPENAARIVAGHDLVLDGLDSIPVRLVLQQVCGELGIPLVHGAVEGWFGQVATVLPGDDTLSRIYPGGGEAYEARPGGPSVLAFAAGLVAAMQAAEAVKLLLGRQPSFRNKMCLVDLLSGSFDEIPI